MADQNDQVAVESEEIHETTTQTFVEEEIDLFLTCSESQIEHTYSGSIIRNSEGTDSIDDDSLTPGKPSRGRLLPDWLK